VFDPYANTHITDTVSISGWAINQHYGPDSGVDRVVIYLDGEARTGQYLGEATYGDTSQDIGETFGDPRFDHSGFHFDWDVSGLAPGSHALYVCARSIEHDNWFFTRRTVLAGRSTYLPIVLKNP